MTRETPIQVQRRGAGNPEGGVTPKVRRQRDPCH